MSESNETKVEENMKVGWRNLGVAETIFEDEDEHEDDEDDDEQSLSSPPLSFPLSSPSSPLQSGVDAWTEATGRKPDVKIQVRGICFDLHKDVLISKSSYFKRHLTRVSEFTLSPPLKVAADTFKQVIEFCYNNHIVITPSNVVVLRTTAQYLEMDGKESLNELTESYFQEVVIVNRTLTCNVFHSCLSLLPEAEQMTFLTSRCIEALLDDTEGDGAVSCADGLKTVSPEGFRVIADSMQRRYTTSHDLLYRVVDLYFLVYNGKMSEDEKTQITSCIDCSILSASLLMHAVQNPRMPLRFIVQAMLIEQLNTHRSLFSVLNTSTTTTTVPRHNFASQSDSPATLGAILERDAALRQVTQLRAAIDTTCSRINSLEKELTGMKKLLLESERDKQQMGSSSILLDHDQRMSSSCRFSNANNQNKVIRGERGSVSSSFLRFGGSVSSNNSIDFCDIKIGSSSCLEDTNGQSSSKVVKKNFGQRFIRGLRNAFGVSSNSKLRGY
ncbi:BTB/POZ domain-containing protein At3g49900 [Beta vulgaris subsp. vulgaris]|uniref:BTB/POZ domain-containing protein At3g49900 n=1 Tax=Beta vulgaris subsp. vulgaris TaxID=3555 RepID=UPI002037236A|nr:BTB/POZ domain-containing protein At3g49900 [Beta vulgaris subsp. vulgaris]